MADRTVTITSTKLIIAANGLQIRFYGLDIIEAKPIQKTTPNVNTGAGDWYVDLKLTGEAREVYGAVYPLRLLDVSNKPAWRNDLSGAQAAAAEIAPMIRSAPSGGGGGQVDTIVAGDAIDVDSTDPVNPIVSVKVDGVTIGFNGSNELEVPAGGGGYVPTSRTIGTTAPLTGGGDLTANRTIAIPQANGSTDGFLDSGDWTTFNNKVSSVGATYPIQSSGGATPTISADTSLGGNGAADDGKVVIFGSLGEITASASAFVSALTGTAVDGAGVYGSNNSVVSPAAEFVNFSGDIAHFHNVTAQGLEVENDGGLDWTSGTGAQTTADNLPVFGALTKGVVPAAGAVPAATNFLTETGAFAVPAGTGINQLTGDVTAGPGSGSQAATLASIIAAGGPTGSATVTPIITYDAKGRLTAVSSATVTPAVGSITGLGTGVATALGNNADSASGFVTQTGGDARYTQIGYAPAQYSIAPVGQATVLVWSNMPAALTFFLGQTRWFIMADLTNRTQIRLTGGVFNVAASANAKLRILYRTQAAGYSTTITDYVTIGTSEVEMTIGTTMNTAVESGWINIVAGAKGKVLIALAGIDGDGAADPAFSGIWVEVK